VTLPGLHPGAARFFDTMEPISEGSKNGPNRANPRATATLGVRVVDELDVALRGAFWGDEIRGQHETLSGWELGAELRYQPWHWEVLGPGLYLGGGAVWPRHEVEGVALGRVTPWGRVGVDLLIAPIVAIRLFAEYTLVAYERAFEGYLPHPVGGLSFGLEIGAGLFLD